MWVTLNLMDERNTSLLVDSLQSKVEKLIIQHKKAKEDIKQLKDENLFLQNKLSETKIQLTDVNEQNKVLKLAKTLSGKEGKSTEIKLKINELIREIDKCIAKVNS
ncbi:MAG: chromosome segregation ATPase [Flavobacteriales bacterium]